MQLLLIIHISLWHSSKPRLTDRDNYIQPFKMYNHLVCSLDYTYKNDTCTASLYHPCFHPTFFWRPSFFWFLGARDGRWTSYKIFPKMKFIQAKVSKVVLCRTLTEDSQTPSRISVFLQSKNHRFQPFDGTLKPLKLLGCFTKYLVKNTDFIIFRIFTSNV